MTFQDHKFSIAPMMDWTDRHCRFFHRQLTKHARIYTEMVTAEAILHGQRDRLLAFDASEQPVALQIGGSDPGRLAEASAIGADYGYSEINLNVGCPSDRVQDGRFGACLMADPTGVAAMVRAMQDAVPNAVAITVKCRIGIDEQDSEADLQRFIDTVADAGITTFVVHARKAWLSGLSPKQNREVPPLDYDRVYRLKASRPDLTIVINGGITTLDDADEHLQHVDGVMMGRAAYQTPYVLANVDQRLFGVTRVPVTREHVLRHLIPYIERHLARGGRLSNVTRHVLGVYHGEPGGKLFRRHLSEAAVRDGSDAMALEEAIAIVEARRQEAHARRLASSATVAADTL